MPRFLDLLPTTPLCALELVEERELVEELLEDDTTVVGEASELSYDADVEGDDESCLATTSQDWRSLSGFLTTRRPSSGSLVSLTGGSSVKSYKTTSTKRASNSSRAKRMGRSGSSASLMSLASLSLLDATSPENDSDTGMDVLDKELSQRSARFRKCSNSLSSLVPEFELTMPKLNLLSRNVSAAMHAIKCPNKSISDDETQKLLWRMYKQHKLPVQQDLPGIQAPTKIADPLDRLALLLEGISMENNRFDDDKFWQAYFEPKSLERTASYSEELVQAVQDENYDKLTAAKDLLGLTLNACHPKTGESLVHVAAVAQSLDMIHYLIHTGQVSIRVRDDNGATPLHQVCRSAPTTSKTGEVFQRIVEAAPELLWARDNDGRTPLELCPEATKMHWCQWLDQHQDNLRLTVQHMRYRHSKTQFMTNHRKLQAILVEHMARTA